MVWDVGYWQSALRTDYIPGVPPDVQSKRMHLIDEAIQWDGNLSQPKQHQISTSSDGSVLLFEKPGKEAAEGTNQNDMRPVIVIKGQRLAPPSFSFIWSDLTNIAMVDFEAFRAILLLVYRNAYLLDHKANGDGKIRYEPEQQIRECIAELDRTVGSRSEFGSIDGLLRFIDLLGWNEDVKYHSFDGRASFTEGQWGGKDKKIGRVRTSLSCIRVPYDISEFMNAHRKEIEGGQKADFVPLYEIMQALINSKGLCVPRRTDDLFRYLDPYLAERSSLTVGRRMRSPLPSNQRTL